MHTKLRLAVLTLAIPSALLGNELPLGEFEIPATANDHAFLGSVYKDDELDIENKACATGEIVETQGATQSEFEHSSDISFDDALNTVNGSIKGGVNWPVVRVNAGATVAQEFADTESSRTFYFVFRVKPKKRSYLNNSFRLTELGEKYLKDPDNLYKNCGKALLTGIEFGGSLHVAMRFDFRNSLDKQEIGGNLAVKVGPKGAVVFNVDGSLNFLSKKVRRSVRLSIKAKQFGGDPLKLTKVLNDKAIHCTLENADQCLIQFEKVIVYARESFGTQFETLDKYNPTKYFATTYDQVGLDQLVPPDGYPTLDELTEILRREIERDYRRQLMDHKLASTILISHRAWITKEQYEKLRQFKQDTFSNLQVLARISEFCFQNPYLNKCKGFKEKRWPQLIETDRSVLTVLAKRDKFYKCENARLAVVEADVDSDLNTKLMRGEGNAPFFKRSSDVSTFQGYGPCPEVAESYGPYFERKAK